MDTVVWDSPRVPPVAAPTAPAPVIPSPVQWLEGGSVAIGDVLLTPEDAVRMLLRMVGEDPDRDGLLDTPKRVVKALREITEGYGESPEAILAKQFDVAHDELIVVRGVEFHSTCEHHLLPFSGTAAVAYIPGPSGKVVGLSKLARLVLCYAKRLQVQERMTNQIARSIQAVLQPEGVGVVVKAHHLCMGCRGVKQPNAEMVTSSMLGALRDQPEARAELLSLL